MPETQVFETQFTAQPFVFSRPWGERSRIVLAANQAGSRRVPFFDLENARAGRGRIGRTSGLTVLLELTTMSRIAPLSDAEAAEDPSARAALEAIRSNGGRVTNMKRTLARQPVALRALLTWYDLRDVVQPFLGERLTMLFAHAISTRTDCLVCSTFFRRLLIDSGEDPDALRLDDWEQAVVDYGRQLGADPNRVSDELYSRLATRLESDQIVALTAFGGLMVATNLFNNALRVDLDDYLQPYRREVRS
jgi:alkylhydroperoxidase family enzyme